METVMTTQENGGNHIGKPCPMLWNVTLNPSQSLLTPFGVRAYFIWSKSLHQLE